MQNCQSNYWFADASLFFSRTCSSLQTFHLWIFTVSNIFIIKFFWILILKMHEQKQTIQYASIRFSLSMFHLHQMSFSVFWVDSIMKMSSWAFSTEKIWINMINHIYVKSETVSQDDIYNTISANISRLSHDQSKKICSKMKITIFITRDKNLYVHILIVCEALKRSLQASSIWKVIFDAFMKKLQLTFTRKCNLVCHVQYSHSKSIMCWWLKH